METSMSNKTPIIQNYYNDSFVLDRVKKSKKYFFLITEPSSVEVVLGRSMILEEDVNIDNCINDNIPIYRRMGGGGTVILAKGIIIISIGGPSSISFHFREQMNSVNEIIIESLEYLGVNGLSINGISDITIGDRKILGSSFYSSKNIVLYQGSLLYNPDFDLFNRYLKQPKKMPEYRKNRSHRDFLTSIKKEGYSIPQQKLIDTLDAFLRKGPPFIRLSARK